MHNRVLFGLANVVVIQVVLEVRIVVQDALLDFLEAQMHDLQEAEEQGDAGNGLHEHHEDSFLRGSGDEAVHHIGARLPLTLIQRVQAVSVEDVLTCHEADLHH